MSLHKGYQTPKPGDQKLDIKLDIKHYYYKFQSRTHSPNYPNQFRNFAFIEAWRFCDFLSAKLPTPIDESTNELIRNKYPSTLSQGFTAR